MNTTTSKQLINLVRGWPATSLLPTAAVSHAAQTVLSDTTVAYPGLLYGPDEGHLPLREAIAAWNTSFYQPDHAITSERVSITGGASQNLGCMLQVFTDPTYTRNIWIVAPAYMLAFRIFQDNGFDGKLRAIREDSQGLDIDSLRREMQKSEDAALAEDNVEPVSRAVLHSSMNTEADAYRVYRNSNAPDRGPKSIAMSFTVSRHSPIPPRGQCLSSEERSWYDVPANLMHWS